MFQPAVFWPGASRLQRSNQTKRAHLAQRPRANGPKPERNHAHPGQRKHEQFWQAVYLSGGRLLLRTAVVYGGSFDPGKRHSQCRFCRDRTRQCLCLRRGQQSGRQRCAALAGQFHRPCGRHHSHAAKRPWTVRFYRTRNRHHGDAGYRPDHGNPLSGGEDQGEERGLDRLLPTVARVGSRQRHRKVWRARGYPSLYTWNRARQRRRRTRRVRSVL